MHALLIRIALALLLAFQPGIAHAACSLDGTPTGTGTTYSPTVTKRTITITTTKANDLIMFHGGFVSETDGTFSFPAITGIVGAGLTWHRRFQQQVGVNSCWSSGACYGDVEEWYARAPAPISPPTHRDGCVATAAVSCSLVGTATAGYAWIGGIVTDATITVSGFTDDKNDSCTIGATVSSGTTLTPVYCLNLTSGAKTFTATLSGASTINRIAGDLYEGVIVVNALDLTAGQHQTTPGTGTDAVSSGSAGTANSAGELVWSITANSTGAAGAGTITSGTSFNARQAIANVLQTEDQIQGAAAAVAGTFTSGNASDSFNTIVMSFLTGSSPIVVSVNMDLGYASLLIWGVNNASSFDTNPSLPVFNDDVSDTSTNLVVPGISTTSSPDMLFFLADVFAPVRGVFFPPQSPLVQFNDASQENIFVAFGLTSATANQPLAAPVTGITVGWDSSHTYRNWSGLVDAVVCSTGGTFPQVQILD